MEGLLSTGPTPTSFMDLKQLAKGFKNKFRTIFFYFGSSRKILEKPCSSHIQNAKMTTLSQPIANSAEEFGEIPSHTAVLED